MKYAITNARAIAEKVDDAMGYPRLGINPATGEAVPGAWTYRHREIWRDPATGDEVYPVDAVAEALLDDVDRATLVTTAGARFSEPVRYRKGQPDEPSPT